jgi:hypothetical protein
MFLRASAAIAAAAVAVMLLTPAPSIARGGAGAAGHAGGFHRPIRPMHPGHPVLVHRHDPLFAHRDFRKRHAFEHRHDGRNFFGFGGDGYGGNGYGGNGYGDSGYGENGYGENGFSGNGYSGYGYCNDGYGYRYPFTCGGYSAFYGRYYDPSDAAGSIWVPPYTVRPAPIVPIVARRDPPVDRGGCRSETVSSPTPGGAERSVTITRC